jgi:YD repeat-containing protein
MARPSTTVVYRAVLALLLCATLLPPAVAAQEVRYVYDALNRLVAVVDPQGNAAEYVYDPVGNLRAIRRYTVAGSAADPVRIFLVHPTQGPPGTAVDISGIGFSAAPTDNHVWFNGTAATVTAATVNTLTAIVPSEATTGAITVTTPLGSATGPDPFTVVHDFVVVPDATDVALGARLAFQARWDGSPTTAVTWRVNGIPGGSTTVGTISAAGVYTAPASMPPDPTVTVTAVRTADPTQVAAASV